MEFSITITRYQGAAPATPTRRRIGEGGCAVGRNPSSDLLLNDPDRVVSGRHVRLELRDGAPWVTDLGSTNGTFLNQGEERLPARQPVRLADGDTLTIGPYELVVAAEQAAAARSGPLDLMDDQFLPGFPGPGAAPDIMDLLTPAGASTGAGAAPVGRPFSLSKAPDPFADALALDPFLGGPATPAEPALATPPPTPFEHVHLRPPETAPRASPAAPLVPDDYDLLADDPGDRDSDPFADFVAPLPPAAGPVPPVAPLPPPGTVAKSAEPTLPPQEP
jgi:type VI secretion system protein